MYDSVGGNSLLKYIGGVYFIIMFNTVIVNILIAVISDGYEKQQDDEEYRECTPLIIYAWHRFKLLPYLVKSVFKNRCCGLGKNIKFRDDIEWLNKMLQASGNSRELLDICCNDLQSQAIMPQVQDRIIRQVPELWGKKLYKDIKEMHNEKGELTVEGIDGVATIKDFFLEYCVYHNRFLQFEDRHTLEITQYAINCKEKNQSHNVQLQKYFSDYKAIEESDEIREKSFFKKKFEKESRHGRRSHAAYKEMKNNEAEKKIDCKISYPEKCTKHVGCMLRRKMIELAHGDFDAVDGKRLYSSTVRKELLSNIPDKTTFRLVIEAILDVRVEYEARHSLVKWAWKLVTNSWVVTIQKNEWDTQGNIVKPEHDKLGPIVDELWEKYKQKVNHTKQEIELRSRKKLQADVKHLKENIREIKKMLEQVIIKGVNNEQDAIRVKH